jgi:hypothetical protein
MGRASVELATLATNTFPEGRPYSWLLDKENPGRAFEQGIFHRAVELCRE